MGSPKVAAVVLNYDGRDLLDSNLESVVNLEYDNLEIVVSDNGSTDGSVRYVQSSFPGVTVVENDENLGYAGGNNAGAAAVPDAEYIWFLNNDVQVSPDALRKLIDYAEATPEVGVLVPRINHMGSERIQTLGFHYDLFGYSFPRDAGQTTPENGDPHEIAYGMGSALLVSRGVWEDVGGFDENNFFYGDDEYLCLQAWVRGYHVVVVPESVVYHERGATISDFFAYHDARNRTRTYLKTFQRSTLLKGLLGYLAIISLKCGKDIAVRRSPRIAGYRLAGLLSAFSTIPEIIGERRQVNQVRQYPDQRFLDSPTEWLNPTS